MKVSKRWLDTFFDMPLPSAEVLADALTFHAFEIDGAEHVGRSTSHIGDEVLDVKVTPNRGHDCLSHRGVAKEISAILQIPLTHDPLATKPDLPKTTDAVSISIHRTDLCSRYIAGYVKGVTVGPSPAWLQERLHAIGQKSINNIVDATNFVMFNLGQPLHAFDVKKLKSEGGTYKIEVRNAKVGEKVRALDDKEYVLGESMLVIGDANSGDAIGIAGVKGGMPAAITEETKDIIIESAHFNAVSVRKTAQALKLRTDASTRFEQGISPELAGFGMQSVVELITQLAGGEVVGFVDEYPQPQKPRTVSVSVVQVQNLLGKTFGEKEITDAFTRLGFQCTQAGEVFTVVVPFERLDLQIPEDLVEEVGRIVGYDQVPATPLPFDSALGKPPVNKNFYAAEHAREKLVAQGYSEVFTSVFADRGERVVLNKIDGVRPYLRDSLLPGLQEALKKNIPNKDLLGLKEIKLFEIGTVWKGREKVMLATISEKSPATEKLLEPVSAEQYGNVPLSQTTRFQPFSKYPYIVRDIAFWINDVAVGPEVDEESVDTYISTIRDTAGELCANISLFDRFEKSGRMSLAFRLIFQSFERTLTEAEVNAIMEKVATSLSAQGFEIR